MKSKKILFAVFALVIFVVPAFIIFGSEDILENGHLHKLQLRGYDPFDPFRGKYLRLGYDDNISCDESLKEGDKAYVTLEKDSLGFSFFSYASSTKPDHDDYIEAELLYVGGGMATIKIDNLTKYFINEDKAYEAELILRDFRRDRPEDLYVAVRVLDGDARLEDIFVEETPLLEYLEKH
jgi:uncharacterized membrane-anchored protein